MCPTNEEAKEMYLNWEITGYELVTIQKYNRNNR
jgi:hypothetical protein